MALALLKMLKTERDDVVSRTALGALATMADASLRPHAADIYPLLESKDPETARAAAFVLGNMGGEPAGRTVPLLRKALFDADPGVQTVAAACLANAGDAAASAVPDLAKAAATAKVNEVRRNSVVALGLIAKALRKASDPRLSKVAPALIEGVRAVMATKVEITDDVTVAVGKKKLREDAAEALSNLGYPHNEPGLDLVRDALLSDKSQGVRQRCVWALFDCSDIDKHPEIKKALAATLEETDILSLSVRYDAARYLAWTLRDKAPDKTIDVLLHMLGNSGLKVFFGSGTAIDGVGDAEKRGGTASPRAAAAMPGSWPPRR